ncbi:MAG: UPF0280 family protein [Thermodesulfobacteriota bacterium]
MEQIQAPVKVIAEDLVLVDWGPMTLTVSAWQDGRAKPVIAAKAGRKALFYLKTLSEFQGYLKRKTSTLPHDRPLPAVVKRALDAVRRMSGDLTPLAAVAGAVADEVAAQAVDMGADRVIVNNGGDIAVTVKKRERAVVGIKPPGSDKMIGRLYVEGGSGIGGVASSGWSGRSHSKGVADMVTVWAENAALADAAATFIAGQTFVKGKSIQKAKASSLDALSDLGDTLVTEHVGELTPGQRRQALERGAAAAEKLRTQGVLGGCMLCLQGDTILMDPDGIMKTGARPHSRQ